MRWAEETYIQRHSAEDVADPRRIKAYDEWRTCCAYERVYLRIKESAKTVKFRLKSLNKMHPKFRWDTASGVKKRVEEYADEAEMIVGAGDDHRDDFSFALSDYTLEEKDEAHHVPRVVDFRNQQAILIGRNITRKFAFNILDGVAQAEVDLCLSKMGAGMYRDLKTILVNVPCGLLVLQGCAGSGKTWLMNVLMQLRLLAGSRILSGSSTNAATNNFAI